MLDAVKTSRVNGLDLEAIGQSIAAIEEDASRALISFDVTTRWAGQCRTETLVEGYTRAGERIARKHRILIDEPVELLGEDSAANPQEMLMAAVNACMAVGYVAGAAVRGIRLDSVEIRTTGTLDVRGFFGLSDEVPVGYPQIDYEVRISGDGSPAEFEEIHQTVMKTSPNYFTLSRPVRMNGSLKVG